MLEWILVMVIIGFAAVCVQISESNKAARRRHDDLIKHFGALEQRISSFEGLTARLRRDLASERQER